MGKQWLEVILPAPADQLEAVCDILSGHGVTGLVVEEEKEFLRFLEENRQYWDYLDDKLMERMKGISQVKFYVPDDEEGRGQLKHNLAGLEQYELLLRPIQEEDWSTCWQKYYQPVCVGERIYIIPEWMRGQPVPDGRTPLYLNPGLTFGTGAHATTQLCLELLEKAVKPGMRVLDLGCGSGILSIAALLLGAGHAAGVDIDPMAAEVTGENAMINGIGGDRLDVYTGDVLEDGQLRRRLQEEKSQLVLANIVADVIIPLSALARGLMARDGVLLCSGILEEREAEVTAALGEHGLTVTQRLGRDGWLAFAIQRTERPGNIA